jgi:hypothetical protein
MFILSFVVYINLFFVFGNTPILEWSFVHCARWWNHAIVVRLNCKIEISSLLWDCDREIIFKPRLSVINIVPIISIAFRISIMSNLELIEA